MFRRLEAAERILNSGFRALNSEFFLPDTMLMLFEPTLRSLLAGRDYPAKLITLLQKSCESFFVSDPRLVQHSKPYVGFVQFLSDNTHNSKD